MIQNNAQENPFLYIVPEQNITQWLSEQVETVQKLFSVIRIEDFIAGTPVLELAPTGLVKRAYVCAQNEQHNRIYQWIVIANNLPHNLEFQVENVQDTDHTTLEHMYRGFIANSYNFGAIRHRKKMKTRIKMEPARVSMPGVLSHKQMELDCLLESMSLVHKLVYQAPNLLSPADFVEIAQNDLNKLGFETTIHEGEELRKNWPGVHMVGKSATHARRPMVIESIHGDENMPRIAIIGKGVVFDTGGNNLKSARGMRMMKKDMSGAAHALALAKVFIELKVPVQIHLIIPLAENCNSTTAMRPGDIYTAKSGKTVEITNTDAEGRLLLADALFTASSHKPNFVLDFATLTGAQEVALGYDVGAIFASEDKIAQRISDLSFSLDDPLWPMPLWTDYEDRLKSKVAHMVNSASQRDGGAITAALFLKKFVQHDVQWVHLDIHSWNHRHEKFPIGGRTTNGLLTMYHYIKTHYSTNK